MDSSFLSFIPKSLMCFLFYSVFSHLFLGPRSSSRLSSTPWGFSPATLDQLRDNAGRPQGLRESILQDGLHENILDLQDKSFRNNFKMRSTVDFIWKPSAKTLSHFERESQTMTRMNLQKERRLGIKKGITGMKMNDSTGSSRNSWELTVSS